MAFRIFIDEVGNHDLKLASKEPNLRYLSLTGVIMDRDYANDVAFPELERLKATFFRPNGTPVTLHRTCIKNRLGPFGVLHDPETREAFDAALLGYLRELNFTAITVVLDKKEHAEIFNDWPHHPYHWCLAAMIERYVFWLDSKDERGDVMAEARGGREDRALDGAFQRFLDAGTDYVPGERIASRLVSRNLKLKTKKDNVAGLQVSDVIAHPSFRAMLCRRQNEPMHARFGGQVVEILESKYRRGPAGQIEGYGRKWLPKA